MENAQLALQSDSMKSKAAAIQARSAGSSLLCLQKYCLSIRLLGVGLHLVNMLDSFV